MKKYFALSLLMFMTFFATAQIEDHDIDIIKEMAQEEQEILEALVLYPKEIRELIFEASTHPEVIIKLANVQSRTSEQFKDLMLKYPEEVQKKIWEMTRYPDLIEQLVAQPGNSEEIIAKYPEKIREDSRSAVSENSTLLAEVNRLNTVSHATFENVIGELPDQKQTVFQQLIQYPEVLDLLNQNIELTILGGDFYKKDPALVIQHADSLNLVVTRKHALEAESWKEELQKDPEALEELQEATKEFAEEYDYDIESLTAGKDQEVMDDLYYDDEEYDYEENYEEDYKVVEHHYYHYPYWFGYPYWYAYPHWRPYPFWYEWGFYWSPYGSVYIYHMPSPFFMHWYFYNPYHHYRYTHLSNHCINHYYGNRQSGSSVTRTVKTWRNANRDVVKEEWLADESKRVKGLKEFGQMEDARDTYNAKHPGKALTKQEYAQKYERKYPTLNKPVRNNYPEKDGVNVAPPTRKDAKFETKPAKPSSQPTMPTKPVRKTKPIVRYKKAQDYHKQTWQKSNTRKTPTVAPSRSRTSPAPKRSSKPSRSTPKRKKN